MKLIFEQTNLNYWYFKLNYKNITFNRLDSIASILDMKESDLENIAIRCGGIKGYVINPDLYFDDFFYFKTFEQKLEFENRMNPYMIMKKLME